MFLIDGSVDREQNCRYRYYRFQETDVSFIHSARCMSLKVFPTLDLRLLTSIHLDMICRMNEPRFICTDIDRDICLIQSELQKFPDS